MLQAESRHERSEGQRSCACGTDEVDLPDEVAWFWEASLPTAIGIEATGLGFEIAC